MKCGAVMLFVNPDPVDIYWKTDPEKIIQIRPDLHFYRIYVEPGNNISAGCESI